MEAHNLEIQYHRCRKLWAAKLIVMVNDYLVLETYKKRVVKRGKKLSTEQEVNGHAAKMWLNDKDNHAVGSLNWICDMLSINAEKIRIGVNRNWRHVYFALRNQKTAKKT